MSNTEIATPGFDLAIAVIKAYAVHNNLTAQNLYDIFNIGIRHLTDAGVISREADCLLAHQLAQEIGWQIPSPSVG